MAVSLYTSRVVLSVLGIDDFGINTIVTSVITMFNFLNHSMAVATSRFLTFELGKNDLVQLKKTFSASLTIHIIIAIIIIFFGETVGLWYVENKMIIPFGRIQAAHWVYQLSLVSAIITITQTPYDASIISHERMNIYAYIEILSVCLKLLIVYLLLIGKFDKLILYAILTLSVTIIIALLYRAYCIKRFDECKYKFEWDKKIIYPMVSFSGWNLYANIGLDTKDKGVNIVLNLFFSTAVNAAFGLANQVSSTINKFYSNFMTALKPQMVKYYAENRIVEMENLSVNATKYSVLLLFTLSFPIIVEIDFILNHWLKNVPDYANIFCQLFLIIAIINTFWGSINYIVYATGKIRTMSFITGTVYLSIPVLSYCFFRLFEYRTVYTPLLISVVASVTVFMVTLVKTKSLIPQFSISYFLKKAVLNSFSIIIISSILPLYFHFTLNESWQRLILVIISSGTVIALGTYYIAFDKKMRKTVFKLLISKIKRI